MSYKQSPESAERYVQGRGEEFRRDLFDKTMTQRQFKEKHGIDQSMISQLRIAIVPREQRRSPHEVTPELLAAFKSSATTKKLAKRFKHDVRRIMQYLQYGESDTLPSAPVPADCSPEVLAILKQKMWIERDPMVESASGCARTSSHLLG